MDNRFSAKLDYQHEWKQIGGIEFEGFDDLEMWRAGFSDDIVFSELLFSLKSIIRLPADV